MLTYTNRIKELREERGINREALANAILIRPGAIWTIEKDKGGCTVDTALRLSEYFEVPIEEIFVLKPSSNKKYRKMKHKAKWSNGELDK